MKINITRTKNTVHFYLTRTVRVGAKTFTKTVEKLGSLEDVKKRAGDMDPYEWAKQYAIECTRKEKEENADIIIKYSPTRQLEKNEQRLYNIGYLFLQDIYYQLGLDKICEKIMEKYRCKYDLNNILSRLIYSRILDPASKLRTYEEADRYLEKKTFRLQHVYRGLEVLCKENDYIQSELYKNSLKVINRKKGILYYDCTNFYFEIEEEDDFRKYGHSKENRPNPIVQMGLFMDADGVPLSFTVFNGNANEQTTMTPLEKKMISDFGMSRFVVCTDAGLSSTVNRRFNDVADRGFITVQSVKKMKSHLQKYCLSPEGWHLKGSRKEYNLNDLNANTDYDKVFYKERWINEDGLEQRLIVSYSLKYQEYQRNVRNNQVERAIKTVSGNRDHMRANDYKRFIEDTYCTDNGEVAEKKIRGINNKKIDQEERYDGFYAVCTNLEDEVESIIEVNKKRWEIKECFRIMKKEFKSRPVYMSRKDRITAHFMTCFMAMIIYRILEKKLGEKYTCEELIGTLRKMMMLDAKGEGYIPAYTRTDLTDDLHEVFGFRTDRQIISNREMKKICTKTKK
jgi:transposase